VVRIDQAKVRLRLTPGSSKTGVIKIENPSNQTKKIRVYVEDWVYLPVSDGSKDFKPAGTTPLSAANWISFSPSEFSIPAFGMETLNYRVTLPSDAKGGHYAVLFFENYLGETKTPVEEGVSVNVAVRIASLFYIEPEGTIERQSKVEQLQVNNKDGQLSITAQFRNLGNIDFTTKGNFSLIDSNGMVYARGEFNDVYTFPGNAADLKASYKGRLPKGKYDLILTIDTGRAWEELGLGRGPVITQEAEVEIGEDGELLQVGELR
jgi:hypothetical protein